MTLEDRKRGIMRGAMFSYIKSIDFFHCPSDTRIKQPETSAACAFRSYSITAGLNSICISDHTTYEKRSNIKKTAKAIVFVEEAETVKGFNHQSWKMWIQRPEFCDPLAVFHGDSCTMGYADGHAQSYRLRTREVLEFFREGKKSLTVDPDNKDYNFFRNRYPYKALN
jgi:prepilin-type processing-associated H-X9-DG protein